MLVNPLYEISLMLANLCSRIEERTLSHLDPFCLFNADEITASTQYLESFADAVIFGDAVLITAKHLAFADLEITEYLTFAL